MFSFLPAMFNFNFNFLILIINSLLMLSILDIFRRYHSRRSGLPDLHFMLPDAPTVVPLPQSGSWDINRGHWMSTEEILEKVLADNFADVTFSG